MEALTLVSDKITQDISYQQFLMKYVEKHGVCRASQKYNRSQSYICFWKQRWGGRETSLACQSRPLHSRLNQHMETEL